MQNIVDAISPVNLADIGIVSLTKLVKEASGQYNNLGQMSLTHALMVAHALKEAYRLGEIRGRALK